ncbi:hypothetical protein FMF70_19550 [Salmonella enterica]|nr:hypothetical protein [Salmonella enterica]
MAMHAATTQKNTVYMNALFIGRNRLFISIFSALRFSITSFLPPNLNKKTQSRLTNLIIEWLPFNILPFFPAKCETTKNHIYEYIVTNVFI